MLSGCLALDHQDVDHARLVAATGDDDVERRLLRLLERGVHDPLAVDQAMRTEPTGPSNGSPARHVATDAAFIAGMS